METSEIAIAISIFSVFTATLSLGWNIYRDVILKSRIKVTVGINCIISKHEEDLPEFVVITALNYGPGKIDLSSINMKNSSICKKLTRKEEYAFLMHDYENPLSASFPCELDVGKKADYLFEYNQKCMLNHQWSHIGITDIYGRTHWAKTKEVKECNEKWTNQFSTNTSE